jgi:biotin operon repressor
MLLTFRAAWYLIKIDLIRAEQNNSMTWLGLSIPMLECVAVDHDSPVPAYEQLTRLLRARIKKGEWSSGPLPSVKQLQQEYDVGRDTVLRAIDTLRTDGLVFTVPRRGTYVTQKSAR